MRSHFPIPVFFFALFFFFPGSPLCAAEDDDEGFNEFAVVQDSDGYANVRKNRDLKSKITGKVKHGQIVWISGAKNEDWYAVDYVDDTGGENYGFIHRSRLVRMNRFKELPHMVSKRIEKMSFENSDMKVIIETEDFEKKNAEISYRTTDDGRKIPAKINGHKFWGCDGGLPHSKYESISIVIEDKHYELPEVALQGLYEPNLSAELTKAFYDEQNGAIYITAENSDGAGGYAVAFRIVNGKYTDRTVLCPF